MRQTIRLLARYLEPGAPTGLTGLWTHATPRSTLIYLYSATLSKLQNVPETSLYRQSVEAVTKHRLELVEKTMPPGYEEWAAKAKKVVAENPEQFRVASGRLDGSQAQAVKLNGKTFIIGRKHDAKDVRTEEWDGEKDEGPGREGLRTEAERADLAELGERRALEDHDKVEWDPEPQLTADQISELEHSIGAGLIEEVIEVAESELKLVDAMTEAKVWEPLEEKPAENQWKYFDRS